MIEIALHLQLLGSIVGLFYPIDHNVFFISGDNLEPEKKKSRDDYSRLFEMIVGLFVLFIFVEIIKIVYVHDDGDSKSRESRQGYSKKIV